MTETTLPGIPANATFRKGSATERAAGKEKRCCGLFRFPLVQASIQSATKRPLNTESSCNPTPRPLSRRGLHGPESPTTLHRDGTPVASDPDCRCRETGISVTGLFPPLGCRPRSGNGRRCASEWRPGFYFSNSSAWNRLCRPVRWLRPCLTCHKRPSECSSCDFCFSSSQSPPFGPVLRV